MNEEIKAYNNDLPNERRQICTLLAGEIQKALPEAKSKVWHGAPVWFIDENPLAGYESAKDAIRLLFWSGQSFNEPDLNPIGKNKAAGISYASIDQVNIEHLHRWLEKSKNIQWDYKNIVKNKGMLERLK